MFLVLEKLVFENYVRLWGVVSLGRFGKKLIFCFQWTFSWL